jgi:hypothetical protein
MEDNRENDKGYVSCAQCGETCDLASIPQVATECTTVEGEQAGNALEVVPEQSTKKPVELECDWSVESDSKQAA